MSWHNQLVLLTGAFQQLGSIVGGVLINAFKPFIQALNSVMGAVINFAQVVSDALGAIFGWEYQVGGGVANDYEAAAGAAEDLEDATGGAAKKAKELNRYIAAWHEVNNMTSNDGGSGGGSGGGGGAGGAGGTADGGEWIQSESLWEKYTSDIDSLYELGDYIQGVLTDAMNSIRWDDVYESARNFGSGLASFLNGLLKDENLFSSIGTTIAGTLNTVLHGLDSFGQKFNWINFGESIAAGINSFFDEFDFTLLASTLNTWVDGLELAIITALQKINWQNIFESAWEFFDELEIDTLTLIVGAVAFKKGLLGKAATAVKGILSGGISVASLGLSIQGFTLANLPSIQVIGNEIISKIDEFIIENFGESVINAMGEALLLIVSTGAGTVIGGPIGALIGLAIGVALDTFVVKGEWATKFWDKVKETLFNFDFSNSLLEQAKSFFEKAFNADNFLEFGANIIAGIGSGIAGAFFYLTEPIADLFAYIVEGICGIFGINSPAEEMKPYGEYILEGIAEGFVDTIQTWITTLGDWATDTFKAFQTHVDNIISNVVGWFANLPENIYNVIIGFVDNVATWGQNIYTSFTTEMNKISGYISGTFSTAWSTAWEGIKTIFTTIWDAMPEYVKTPIRTIIGVVNKMIAGIESGINSVITGLNRLSFDVPDWVPGLGGESFGFSLSEVSLPRVPELARGGIISRATIAMIGEDGAEAVIPLERNAGWMSRIAGNIVDEMGNIRLNIMPDTTQFQYKKMRVDTFAQTQKIQESIGQFMEEVKRQNGLLEDVVTAIENKQLQIGDDQIFNSTRRAQQRFLRRTGKVGWSGI